MIKTENKIKSLKSIYCYVGLRRLNLKKRNYYSKPSKHTICINFLKKENTWKTKVSLIMANQSDKYSIQFFESCSLKAF